VTPEDASSQALSEALSSSFKIIRFLMVALLAVFFFSGSFIVGPNEVVVLLRFGKPVGKGPEMLKGPGWHWAYPPPIDEKVRIRVGETKTVASTAGWHAVTPEMEASGGEPPPRGYLSPEADGYVITADGNIIHARARVKYRVTDPLRYFFGFAKPETILTNIVNEAIFYAAARMTADDALYKNKSGYRDLVLARVNELVDELSLGVTLEPSDVETKPPADVRQAFENVISAEQERSRAISDARGYQQEILRRAQGEAQAILNEGLTRSNRLVQAVAALAESFEKMLPEYEKDPWLFRNRLLIAALGQVATNAQDKFFLPELPPGVTREIRLLLNRTPMKPKSASGRRQP